MAIHTHSLVFDTNIFRKIIGQKNDHLHEHLFRQLNKEFNSKAQFSGFYSTITPFLMMEYLGVRAPNVQVEYEPKIIKADGFLAPKRVFKDALAKYDALPELTEKYLINMNHELKKRISPKATKLYEDMVENIIKKKNFDAYLRQNLALDYSYRFQYEKFNLSDEELFKISYNSILDIMRAHKTRFNLTQMRGVISLAQFMQKRLPPEGVDAETNRALAATTGIKEFRDLADLDLVQIVCLGAFLDSQPKMPVIAFTGDPEAEIRSRIHLFKHTFDSVKNNPTVDKHISEDPKAIEKVEERPGIVIFVDQNTCDFKNIFNVK